MRNNSWRWKCSTVKCDPWSMMTGSRTHGEAIGNNSFGIGFLNRHERVERRWLGSARVPLSALYAMTKLDGHLALQEPLFFSGYKFFRLSPDFPLNSMQESGDGTANHSASAHFPGSPNNAIRGCILNGQFTVWRTRWPTHLGMPQI